MEEKELERSEISDEFKWDLSRMFKSDKDWEEAYKSLEKEYPSFLQYKDKITNAPEILYNSLENYFKIDRNLTNIFVYARMRSDEDKGNSYYQTLLGKAETLASKISETTAFFSPELLKADYNVILTYLADYEKLNKYKRYLEETFRIKPYILSENEEKLMASFSKIFNSASKTAGLLRDSDLEFGNIVDENGNEVRLTNSNYSLYIESKNPEVRKRAFKTLSKGYESVKNTLASTLMTQIENTVNIAKIRGYKSPLEYSLFGNNIDPKIYHNLIDVVNKNLDILHKYYKMKKEVLDIDELHIYDTNFPLEKGDTTRYDFNYAKETVLNALSILGEDYTKTLKSAFEDRWIDVYPSKRKSSGAYSFGTYDSFPYILLNYKGTFHDMSTLAHELGHSMHSYYSDLNNEYHDAGYSIFVAEVASTVNELILSKYLLNNTNDKKEKRMIINGLMETFKSTIYRQTMFAEFELDIYNRSNDGEILTHELLSNIYYDLTKKYFGNNVIVDDEIRYEWARVPHFYYFFYVYQYATGLSAAYKIVDNIFTKGESYIQKYLEFLKTGGRDYPVELLKIAEVDMSEPNVIETALKEFDKYIDEYKSYCEE